MTQDQIRPGIVVRTNYGSGPYTVEVVARNGGLISLCCRGGYYLNGLRLDNGRLIRDKPWLPGSSGYLSNGGGRDGDGYDEVFIVASPPPETIQLNLFEGE